MHIQEIKINVPDGKKAVYDEAKQTIKFVDAEPVRSKSWEEFCQNHPQVSYEYFIHQSAFNVVQPTTETRMNLEQSKGLLETQEDAEGIIALIQLKRLHDEWVSECDPRYFAVVRDKDNNITIECHALERECKFLSFPTIEMAAEFWSCFKYLIETAKMFI